jgi:hypothetical protein
MVRCLLKYPVGRPVLTPASATRLRASAGNGQGRVTYRRALFALRLHGHHQEEVAGDRSGLREPARHGGAMDQGPPHGQVNTAALQLLCRQCPPPAAASACLQPWQFHADTTQVRGTSVDSPVAMGSKCQDQTRRAPPVAQGHASSGNRHQVDFRQFPISAAAALLRLNRDNGPCGFTTSRSARRETVAGRRPR